MRKIVVGFVVGLIGLTSVMPASASSHDVLRPGDAVEGPAQKYELVHQTDGNVVLYNEATQPVWHTQTHGTNTSRLVMQGDGNFVLYDAANKPVWHSGTYGNPGARLAVQGDGNIVIYKSDGKVAWAIKHWPPPPPPAPKPYVAPHGVWDKIAQCESHGNWSINTGNGYYGGLQMNMQFWISYGGKAFAPYPHQTSRTTQIMIAERARDGYNGHRARGYYPWPHCGAPYR